jgi:two-component system OmpR family response regulator
MVKPFAVAELVARVKLAARRRAGGRDDRRLVCADLEMDDDAHRVTRAGAVVSLSPTEYTLLRYLLVNSGRVLSRAQILDHVWQYDFDGDSSVVDTFISYVRRKVDHVEPKLIHTIRGVGYCLRQD